MTFEEIDQSDKLTWNQPTHSPVYLPKRIPLEQSKD